MTASGPRPWDSLPLVVLVPEGVSGTTQIRDQHAALKIPVVARSGADLGGDEWDALSMTKELVDRPHAYVCENS